MKVDFSTILTNPLKELFTAASSDVLKTSEGRSASFFNVQNYGYHISTMSRMNYVQDPCNQESRTKALNVDIFHSSLWNTYLVNNVEKKCNLQDDVIFLLLIIGKSYYIVWFKKNLKVQLHTGVRFLQKQSLSSSTHTGCIGF